MTNLLQILGHLDDYPRGSTIYAVEPWTPTSRAVVAAPPPDGSISAPAEAAAIGATYFLEIFLAKELSETLTARPEYPTLESVCARIIEYAVHDA